MKDLTSSFIQKVLSRYKVEQRKKVILGFVALFALVTTAVIMGLPAITATPELICGKEEHVHTDECYTEEKTLICEKEEHIHTDECYEKAGKLTSQAEDEMVAEISYEAGVVHDGSSFSVKLLKDELIEVENKDVTGLHIYNLSLIRNDKFVEPDGIVDVNISFKEAIAPKDEETEWKLYRVEITDEGKQLVDLTEDKETVVHVDKKQAVTEILFKTDTMGEYALVGENERETETVAPETKKPIVENKITSETTKVKDESVANKSVKSFKQKANGITVSVRANEGAFPDGTTMKVKAVKNEKVLNNAIKAAGNKKAKAKAVDISFYNKEGKEIEPASEIRVTMQAKEVKENENVKVVHVDDKNQAEVVKNTETADQVTFKADEFSTYVLVYTVDFSYGEYEYSIKGESSIMLSQLLKRIKDGC
ncbi:hypothetical protein P261_01994 [Lachnospiraceae bacterium TWA4]|nr:hypothetical protein P261_01994 [Lachnospiraceae bacterium TWA4]